MPEDCEQTLPRVIRLTVDSGGLQQIERLQEMPDYRPGRSENQAFALFHEEVQGAIAYFKSGFAQLASGNCKTETMIRFWDTPTPIQIQFCPRLEPRTERILTAELCEATGITFFLHRNMGIVGVQAHSDGFFPCASPSSPFDELSWIYIPTPPGDKITACKTLEYYGPGQDTFLYRKQLSGMAGFTILRRARLFYGNPLEDLKEEVIMPTVLITQHPRPTPTDEMLCHLAPYRGSAIDELGPVAPLKAVNMTSVYQDYRWEYSTPARLCDLASIQIFYLPERFQPAFQEEYWKTNQVHGVVLTFDNGAQTALGQCRFDICRTRTFHKPIQISMLRACHCRVVDSGAQSTSVGDRHCPHQRCLSEAVIQPTSVEEDACSAAGHDVHHDDGSAAKPKLINYPATDQYVIRCLMTGPTRVLWAIDIERPRDFQTEQAV
ncbi:hypothetical protein QBC40DRAFT_268512 [Triangularia verruculosa]|uniref:Uncharacterized protein n=1 Tax=Triangularia verruculosa TaxID=2587418 RepID=A0AAN7AR74_9PEZI|nr:hypothetical protein QBC40DRAFT_268512 [Triangularia verruculosa]